MKHIMKLLSLGAALAVAPLAYATPISGSIGFGGNGTYNAATNQFTAGSIIAGTTGNAYVNGPATTGPTGTLSGFTLFNPATFYSFNSVTIPAGGEQVFTTTENGVTLSFLLTSFTADGTTPAGGGFSGSGTLSETGYTNTAASFTLNTNAGAGTFVTFNTAAAATPEPSSLVLLGSGLVSAAGMLLRRRLVV